MGYGFLADMVVAVHIAYVSYVVFGELAILLGMAFRWQWVRNPWFRWSHLVAIVIVAVEALLDITCPLTDLEGWLRRLAGEATSEMSFIGRCLDNVLFYEAPHALLTALYIGFAVLVLATFWLAPPRRRQQPGS